MDFERDSIILSGTWERLSEHGDAEVWKREVAAGLGPWEPVDLPGPVLRDNDRNANERTNCVWVRKTFQVDEGHATRDAVLKWGGIRFGATAWLNGREIGSHAPVGPHTIIIQPGVIHEGENELLLKVRGWGSLHKSPTDVPLIPVGADLFWGGRRTSIYDDVWLEFYDAAYMKWILAIPNLEAGTVTFRVRLDSAGELPGAVDIHAAVHPNGDEAPAATGRAQAQDPGEPIEVTVALDDVKPWTPLSPHLYVAELRAEAGGKVCDETRFRFGMRQIGLEEGHYRLNGRPLWFRGSNLVSEWTWNDIFNREVKRYVVDEARAMNLNSFRTHTLPPPTRWLDVCDEHGTMIMAEFSVTYNYHDFAFTPEEWDRFHQNVLLDAQGWVTKLWNHPSVVMWVLTNEPRGDSEWEAGPYHEHVRALDPTRPCMRTGDMNRGTESVLDMHPTYNYNFGPDGSLQVAVAHAAEQKDPRRALTNTEYMNVFGPFQHVVARRLGRPDHPDAKLDFAECAAEDTEAMRRLQFDAILPYMYAGWPRFRGNNWRPDYPTPMAAALHSSMAPVLASLDLFDRNFVAGREVTTPLYLINELSEDVAARVDIYVTPQNPLIVPDEAALSKAVSHESLDLTFKADSIKVNDVRWRVPKEPGVYYLAAVLTREGDRPVVSQRTVRAVAQPRAAADLRQRRILVLGADPAIERWLKSHGMPHEVPVVFGDTMGDVMLVWDQSTPESLDEGAVRMMHDLAARGGRLVILDPGRWNWQELVDFEVGQARPSSRVFPYPDAAHRMLAGVDPEFLKRWNGLPGTVAEGCIQGEILERGRKLLWADSPDKPVAVSLPVGEGEIVVSLLHVKGRINAESDSYDPVAEQMLLNLLGP